MRVERSQIEQYFQRGKFLEALDGLEHIEPSAWRDTTRLRCLRAMGHGADSVIFANELFETLNNKAHEYRINTSKRNHQLRYIALVFAEQGQAEQASQIMQELCEQSPEVASLHREHAFALNSNDELDGAELALNRAIELQPMNANSHAQLARIYCRTGRVKAGYNSYSMAASLEPENPNYLQRLIYWSNFSELTTPQSNYQLTKLWVQKAHPNNQSGTNTWRTVNPERQLRIGFISSDFCAHSVSFSILPLLEGLNRSQFHITAYNDSKKSDSITESIRKLCDSWHDVARSTDKSLSALVASDQIDILVDLNGHSTGNRLSVFSKHVAPIQLSWLGYPSTTGLKSINYRITDRVADPIGDGDEFYSEKLVRLTNGFLCYKPLETAPAIAPVDGNGEIRFGAFCSLSKISSLTLDCWAAAMHAVPNSTLQLKRQELKSKHTQDFFLREFSERGIEPQRIILNSAKSKIDQHLDSYNQIDLTLDTTPYNGTTTTLESLWMGVPVVSMVGRTHASRISASILRRLNLDGMATSSVTEFANRAKEMSELGESRNELRHSLRHQMEKSSLMNSQQFGREFGNALREKWRAWCQDREKEADTQAPERHSSGDLS
ncbi:glycosyltransferase family 41 protein [Arenicella xantha]|uniref:protein O-GlcNAc transferase n=1 Tax=Arenicella xantha TaxID=644221 RepID=A0A395JNW6_9GAMM|nr:glycosyltransferase family 41 protein [Arenicella xantha]RBP53334.1 putative O-linked N-acetylglucosamine transferase (SPINDLY family) [Arenicella xantha]